MRWQRGQWLLTRLLQSCCVNCGAKTMASQPRWCDDCWHQAGPNAPLCPQCGLPSTNEERPCGRCQQHDPGFERLYAIGLYQGPVSALITRFKYHQDFAAGQALIDRWQPRLPLTPEINALLPVPMHPIKRARRGMNQAHWLAHALNKQRATPIPILHDVIRHQFRHDSQAGATRTRRFRMARQDFQIHHPQQLEGKRIAIIDDVVTTGATAAALSEHLYRAGAQYIEVWCLARTP